jgi:hypothetical protein
VELAYGYVGKTALMDFRDLEQNTRDGVHIASLAGTWIAVFGGLGGMRDHEARLSFAPRLPSRLDRLEFSLWRGRRLRITISWSQATYSIRAGHGTAADLLHYGEPITVNVGGGEEGAFSLLRGLQGRPRRRPDKPAGTGNQYWLRRTPHLPLWPTVFVPAVLAAEPEASKEIGS